MKHRVFIAINLLEEIKKEFLFYQGKWPELPVRWVKPENLHITLVFLGYLSDEELPDILKIVREAAKKHNPFSINLTKVCYGPPKKPPRMVWVTGEKSDALGKLQTDIEKNLLENFTPCPPPFSEKGRGGAGRPYAPHINLGRIRQWEFRQIEPEERPEINEEINLGLEVNSIEVMESQLKRGGAEYAILESVPLSR
ncbi:MAG: RNA 2',3'-cyclic phosphodiesterase [Candidatus Nealsonbacteria bacterium CG08_land_8_20_14_0_20_38_20]|uniref:RNA 2',3'-cyclic phosphodiesterase n=1 Tax=Candidatus Nealsonbacteria bacterium CG08_land_8_20_14_0_20_38_20 TaxID=1974705 RepID=A0A2H0YL92_9BACT|nr:MAG: RNA 2',3'-cyclic phosphodiesterase [Candidatus Nealsonbacteria bacterium CG08_land_8_20_14_0_20_38_20]